VADTGASSNRAGHLADISLQRVRYVLTSGHTATVANDDDLNDADDDDDDDGGDAS